MKTSPLSRKKFLSMYLRGCEIYFSAGGFAYLGVVQSVQKVNNEIILSVGFIRFRKQFSSAEWYSWWGSIFSFYVSREVRMSLARDGDQIYLGGFERAVIKL